MGSINIYLPVQSLLQDVYPKDSLVAPDYVLLLIFLGDGPLLDLVL